MSDTLLVASIIQKTWRNKMIFTGTDAAAMIDISAVRTHHTLKDVQEVAALGMKYHFINVHVLPNWVPELAALLRDSEDTLVGSAVGFPSGGASTIVKLKEEEQLLKDGAQELDFVMNVGRFKSKEFDYVENELKQLIESAGPQIVKKVIIEVNCLTRQEVFDACDLVAASGADFVKTSTGWIPGGLDVELIQDIKTHCGKEIKVKAAGGIRTCEDFISLVKMGVERIGINVRSAIEIVNALNEKPYVF